MAEKVYFVSGVPLPSDEMYKRLLQAKVKSGYRGHYSYPQLVAFEKCQQLLESFGKTRAKAVWKSEYKHIDGLQFQTIYKDWASGNCKWNFNRLEDGSLHSTYNGKTYIPIDQIRNKVIECMVFLEKAGTTVTRDAIKEALLKQYEFSTVYFIWAASEAKCANELEKALFGGSSSRSVASETMWVDSPGLSVPNTPSTAHSREAVMMKMVELKVKLADSCRSSTQKSASKLAAVSKNSARNIAAVSKNSNRNIAAVAKDSNRKIFAMQQTSTIADFGAMNAVEETLADMLGRAPKLIQVPQWSDEVNSTIGSQGSSSDEECGSDDEQEATTSDDEQEATTSDDEQEATTMEDLDMEDMDTGSLIPAGNPQNLGARFDAMIDETWNGIPNLSGIDCYWITALQILKTVALVVPDFLVPLRSSQGPISRSVLFMLDQLVSAQNASVMDQNVVNHFKFTTVAVINKGVFNTNTQQDIHEFILALVDEIDTENMHMDSFPFGFYEERTIHFLSCGHSSQHQPKLNFLQLNMPPNPCALELLSVVAMLQAYFQPIPHEDNACEDCKGKDLLHGSTERISMSTFPDILAVQIARFPAIELKDTREISIPRSIDGKVKYDLIAIACHHGATPQSGHYTATAKRGGHWYQFDDKTVERTAPLGDHFTSATAYLLFYKKEPSNAPKRDASESPPRRNAKKQKV